MISVASAFSRRQSSYVTSFNRTSCHRLLWCWRTAVTCVSHVL